MNSELNFVNYVYFTLYRFLHKCLNKPCHVLVKLSNRVTFWNLPYIRYIEPVSISPRHHRSRYKNATPKRICTKLMESDGYFEVKFLSAKNIFRLFNMKRVRLIFTFHRQVWRQKGKMIIVCDQAESCKSIAVERNTNTKLTVCEFILLDRQIGINKCGRWPDVKERTTMACPKL